MMTSVHDFYFNRREAAMSILSHVEEQLRLIALDMNDKKGVNAVLEVNPDALGIAGALDQIPPERRGALHGMTVLLKDNINTADGMHTSAGSLALDDHIAAEDASVVRRLRDAGAVLLGKANMTELANYMSFEMPPGYSARGGQVRNPHNKAESPSGSSSGCAAAVAAGFCDLAVGTETSGSIISPSQCCGVVGIKPSAGLVGRTGLFPISITLDTAGPIAGTVAGAAQLLSVIAGYDREDPATAAMRERTVPTYADLLDPDGLNGARIGVNRGVEASGAYRPHSERFLRFLEEQGAVLVEIEPIAPDFTARDIMDHEFKAAVFRYFATSGRNAKPRTLEDIAAFNRAHAGLELRYGQKRLEAALNVSGTMTEPAYLNAQEVRQKLTDRLLGLYEKYELDAVVETAGWNTTASLCGFPAGTVPIGRYPSAVPVGCYLMCRPFEEQTLLSLLYAVEQNIGYR
jgi:amidase